VVRVNGLKTSDLAILDEGLGTFIEGRAIATCLRLAFHDCVGGCDGCINVNNHDNAGLVGYAGNLATIYDGMNLKTLLTRADFVAYAGIYSVKKSIEVANANCPESDPNCKVPEINLTLQTGRVDCDTAPYTDVDVGLPSSDLTYEELTAYFADNFGLNAEESVALMGAHTIGEADPDQSGFNGAWVVSDEEGTSKTEWNNEYYIGLLNGNGVQSDVSGNGNWQWISENTETGIGAYSLMLNADMCLLKDLKLDSNGKSSCDRDSCGDSEGKQYVKKFADSQNKWMEKFAVAFTKVQATGNFTLVPLED